MKPKSHLKPAKSRSQSKTPVATPAKNLARPKIILASSLLPNDQLWSLGDVVVVEHGRAIHLTPRFQVLGDAMLQPGDIPLTGY